MKETIKLLAAISRYTNFTQLAIIMEDLEEDIILHMPRTEVNGMTLTTARLGKFRNKASKAAAHTCSSTREKKNDVNTYNHLLNFNYLFIELL
jgi:hypothetical protein